MNTIGLRCSPKIIFYTIISVDSEDNFTLSNHILIIPQSFSIPEKLKYVRKTFLDIINENKIERAGIRIAETVFSTPDTLRTYLEGCIQELIASSTVKEYFTGAKAAMAKSYL